MLVYVVVFLASLMAWVGQARPASFPSRTHSWNAPASGVVHSLTSAEGVFEHVARHQVDDHHYVHVRYSGRMADDSPTVHLDDEHEIDDVRCTYGEMTLHFQAGDDARLRQLAERLQPGAIVLGSYEWGCVSEGRFQQIMHLVTDRAMPGDQPHTLVLGVTPAAFQEVFRDLELNLETNYLHPTAEIKLPLSPTEAQARLDAYERSKAAETSFAAKMMPNVFRTRAARFERERVFPEGSGRRFGEKSEDVTKVLREMGHDHQRELARVRAAQAASGVVASDRSIESTAVAIRDALNAFLKAANSIPVKSLVEETLLLVEKGREFLQTGDFSLNSTAELPTYNQVAQLNLNYDSAKDRAATEFTAALFGYENIRCSNCYFYLIPNIKLYIKIVDKNLVAFDQTLGGSVKLNVEVTLDQQDVGLSLSLPKDIPLASGGAGPYALQIYTLTLILEPLFSMGLNFELDVFLKSSVSGRIQVGGDLYTRVWYDPSSPFRFNGTANASLSVPTPTFDNPATEIDLNFIPFLTPSIALRINFLGGPAMTVRPNLQFVVQSASHNLEYCRVRNPKDTWKGGLNFGVAVDVGLSLNVGTSVFQIIAESVISLSAFDLVVPGPKFCLPSLTGQPLLRGEKFLGVQTAKESDCSILRDYWNSFYTVGANFTWNAADYPQYSVVELQYAGFFDGPGETADWEQYELAVTSDFCVFEPGYTLKTYYPGESNRDLCFNLVNDELDEYKTRETMVLQAEYPADLLSQKMHDAHVNLCANARVPHIPRQMVVDWVDVSPGVRKMVARTYTLANGGDLNCSTISQKLDCPRWELIRGFDLKVLNNPASELSNDMLSWIGWI